MSLAAEFKFRELERYRRVRTNGTYYSNCTEAGYTQTQFAQFLATELGYTGIAYTEFTDRYIAYETDGVGGFTPTEWTLISTYFNANKSTLEMIRSYYEDGSQASRRDLNKRRREEKWTLDYLSFAMSMPIARVYVFDGEATATLSGTWSFDQPQTLPYDYVESGTGKIIRSEKQATTIFAAEITALETLFNPIAFSVLISVSGTPTTSFVTPFLYSEVFTPSDYATYNFFLNRWEDGVLEQGYRNNRGGAKGAFLFYGNAWGVIDGVNFTNVLQFALNITRGTGGIPGASDLYVYGHPYATRPATPLFSDLILYGAIAGFNEGDTTGNPGVSLLLFPNFETDLLAGNIKGLCFYAKSEIEYQGQYVPGGYREFDPNNPNFFIALPNEETGENPIRIISVFEE